MSKRTAKKPEHDVKPEASRKTRRCLMCREQFESTWAGERVCRRCKSTNAWREGQRWLPEGGGPW